jgi:hypothetical protein
MPGPLRAANTLDGYPQGAFGDRYASCVDHIGPAVYAPVVNGTPPTGGDVLTAAEFGLKALTMVWSCESDNGQYLAIVTPTIGGKGEPTSWIIRYVTAATGAEVGAIALNARTFRFFALGR